MDAADDLSRAMLQLLLYGLRRRVRFRRLEDVKSILLVHHGQFHLRLHALQRRLFDCHVARER